MGDFDLFKNIHVRNYYELKRNGQYEKALAELQIACDEEDGQGLYVMSEHVYKTTQNLELSGQFVRRSAEAKCPWGMFMHGYQNCTKLNEKNKWYKLAYDTGDKYIMGKCLYHGYLPQNRQLGIEYLQQACAENNPFAFEMILDSYDISEDQYLQLAKRGAYLGIPKCQLVVAGQEFDLKKKFEWYVKGHLQKFQRSTNSLAYAYLIGAGCKVDTTKGAKLLIESGDDIRIHSRLHNQVIDLKELIVYGKAFKINAKLRNNIIVYHGGDDTMVNKAIDLYDEIIIKTKKMCFYFLLCTKQVLVKDVCVLIAKMIWEFREDLE